MKLEPHPGGKGAEIASSVSGDRLQGAYGSEVTALLTVKEVAELLRLTEETVCAYIRRGELRASAMGTDASGRPCPPYLVRSSDLDALLNARAVQVAAGPPPVERRPAPTRNTRGRARSVQLVSPVAAT